MKNPIKGFTYNGATAMVQDIQFINIVLGNTLVTQANHTQFFDIDPATTSNITFTTEGTIYTVNATSSAGGTLSPSGALPTPAGMTRTITPIPAAGKRIKRVLINGTDQGRLQNISFENIAANHTVFVEFENGDDYFDKPIIPTPPTVLGATPLSADSIAILWLDTSTNETSFEVQRSLDGSTSWTTINTLAANTQNYIDTGLTTGAPYFYRVRAASPAGSSSWSETTSASPSSTFPVYDASATILIGNTSNDVITSTPSSAHFAIDANGLLSHPGVTMTTSSGFPWRFQSDQNLGNTPAGNFSLIFNAYQEVDETTGEGLLPLGGYDVITSNSVGVGIGNGANGNFIGNKSGAGGAEGIIFGIDASGLPPQVTLRLKSVTLNQTGSNFFTGQDSARIISRLAENPSITTALGSPTNQLKSVTVDVETLNITVTGGSQTPELFTILNGTDSSLVGFRVQSIDLQIGLPIPAPPGSFTAWAAINAPGEGPENDHDHDGMPNGIEHLMGETGSSFTPNPGIAGNTLTWPKDPLALSSWEVQFSENLGPPGTPGGWAPAPAEFISDTGNSIIVTIPENFTQLFIRLSVTPQ